MRKPEKRRSVRRICLILAATLALACAAKSHAQSLRGVNLAGPAFAPSNLPGVYGSDYVYPNDGEVAYFTSKGMNAYRISVLWERLQPALNQPFNPDEIGRLVNLVSDIHKHGGTIVIDVHNYGSYRGVQIGQNPVTIDSFADLWVRLAKLFGHDDYVMFGLMNEPQLQQTDLWQQIVQQTINAIRGAGATNRILVSGLNWDAAYNFATVSGQSLGALKDPLHRLIFEVHEYFDNDSSGTNEVCIDPDEAIRRLSSFTAWLRVTNRRGFLGEFGVSRRPECLAVLDRVMSYLQANSDVWLGWTYWAAGPRWGEYMYTIEPAAGQDRPQMLVLEKYLRPASQKN